MKSPYLHLILLALFGLSPLTATAAQQLASAKVLSMSGTVTSASEDGVESPLMIGAILGQGDSIVTGAWSTALLVFSNGSEILVTEEIPALQLWSFPKKHLEGLKAMSNSKQIRVSRSLYCS